jgi:hypothetical protein
MTSETSDLVANTSTAGPATSPLPSNNTRLFGLTPDADAISLNAGEVADEDAAAGAVVRCTDV